MSPRTWRAITASGLLVVAMSVAIACEEGDPSPGPERTPELGVRDDDPFPDTEAFEEVPPGPVLELAPDFTAEIRAPVEGEAALHPMDGGTALIASMGVDAPEAYTANLYEGSCDDVGDALLSFGGFREHTETGTSISVFIDAPPESVADGHAIIVLDMEAEEHGIVGCGEFVAADEG